MGTTGKIRDYFAAAGEFTGFRVEIRSNRSIRLEGCDGILSYSDEEIIIKAGKLIITLEGRDLHITVYNDEGIVVEGVLNRVNYGYR